MRLASSGVKIIEIAAHPQNVNLWLRPMKPIKAAAARYTNVEIITYPK